MVIVQLSGGLGNQMFEYALYLRLKAEGRQVKIDDSTCYGHEGERPLQLGRVFGVTYDRASEEEIRRMTDSFPDPVSRIRRKLLGRKNLSYREADVNFDPEVLKREPVLLEGCFQSERYFAPVADQVREAYRFRKDGEHHLWTPEAIAAFEKEHTFTLQAESALLQNEFVIAADNGVTTEKTGDYKGIHVKGENFSGAINGVFKGNAEVVFRLPSDHPADGSWNNKIVNFIVSHRYTILIWLFLNFSFLSSGFYSGVSCTF